VITPDVNLLVYVHNTSVTQHAKAFTWWSDLLSTEQPIGIPWAVVFGFIRLVTHPAVLVDPITPDRALALTRGWLDREHVSILEPGPRHLDIVGQLFTATGVAGRLTTDTHLAAIAIEYQTELHTNDADFARFPGLRHFNPLRA
jgi:toxin-antitoxin system PIN domain toxin